MLVLWDLDGTLTDPLPGIAGSVGYALERLGLPPLDARAQRAFVGPPMQESFAALGLSPPLVEQAIALYRERYSERGLYEVRLHDGVPQVLDELAAAGVRLAVATSKPVVFAVRVLEHVGLGEVFEHVAGATLDGSVRSKADVVALALQATRVGAGEALMVGDRAQDVEGAHAHGVACVGVRWGYAEPGELEAAGADAVAETPAELSRLLRAGVTRPAGSG